MHCVSCQAQLAPGATTCYFCGASQPSPGAAGPYLTAQQHVRSIGQGPVNEGWRIWVSLCLGGLYAPIASEYLLKRERWGTPGGVSGSPPSPPSNRGLAVVGLFVGVPVVSAVVMGWTVAAGGVGGWSAGDPITSRIAGAHHVGFWAMIVGWFYVLSALLARRIDREFAVLLHEVTGGSRAAAREYRPAPLRRRVAEVLSAAPFALCIASVGLMAFGTWHPILDDLAFANTLAVVAAAWATSWLHISPLHRFRRAVRTGLP